MSKTSIEGVMVTAALFVVGFFVSLCVVQQADAQGFPFPGPGQPAPAAPTTFYCDVEAAGADRCEDFEAGLNDCTALPTIDEISGATVCDYTTPPAPGDDSYSAFTQSTSYFQMNETACVVGSTNCEVRFLVNTASAGTHGATRDLVLLRTAGGSSVAVVRHRPDLDQWRITLGSQSAAEVFTMKSTWVKGCFQYNVAADSATLYVDPIGQDYCDGDTTTGGIEIAHSTGRGAQAIGQFRFRALDGGSETILWDNVAICEGGCP